MARTDDMTTWRQAFEEARKISHYDEPDERDDSPVVAVAPVEGNN